MNEAKRHAIAAGHVFDGWTRHKDAAVVVEGSLIVGVVPQSELPLGIEVRKLPSEVWLAPGFIDLQVNGGGDVLFNNSPTPEAILAIAAAHRKFGTTSLLPTFITDTSEKMTVAFTAAEHQTGRAGHPWHSSRGSLSVVGKSGRARRKFDAATRPRRPQDALRSP